jgi:hypothetical protein
MMEDQIPWGKGARGGHSCISSPKKREVKTLTVKNVNGRNVKIINTGWNRTQNGKNAG